MGKVRGIQTGDYKLRKYEFLHVYYYCLRYNEWRDELAYKTDTVKSIEISDAPRGSGNEGNATEDLAIRRAMLSKNCEVLEQTAIEADADLYQYIIKAATNEHITYDYLKLIMDIPCSRNTWYQRRRKFYWLMSKKIP